VVLASGLQYPRGIVSDGTYVYWMDYMDGMLRRVSVVPGGTPAVLATFKTYKAFNGAIAVDGTAVYLAVGSVLKVPKAGGSPTILSSANATALVADSANIYYTTSSSLNKVSKTGGTSTVLVTYGEQTSARLAVDANAIYWSDCQSNVGSVMKVSIGGGSPVAVASGQQQPCGIAVDSVNLYWNNVSESNTIMKSALQGGTPAAIWNGNAWGGDLLADGANLYWSTGSSEILRMPIGAATPVTIANGQGGGNYSLAADSNSVYWTKSGSQGNGMVLKVAQ